MKLAGDASRFPNPQHQLQYTFELLVGQAFVQVKAHITNKGINLTDLPALITALETAFGNPDHVATAERKLEMLKQADYDFSTYYAEFQHYATDIQWNDPAKHTTPMWGLNNEIKDLLPCLTICLNSSRSLLLSSDGWITKSGLGKQKRRAN
jgi:hypothetical protein